jgi:hypothetical protein
MFRVVLPPIIRSAFNCIYSIWYLSQHRYCYLPLSWKSWNRFECAVGGVLTIHGTINVKSPNNTSKWQMGFNSAFKGLTLCHSDMFEPSKGHLREVVVLVFSLRLLRVYEVHKVGRTFRPEPSCQHKYKLAVKQKFSLEQATKAKSGSICNLLFL